MRVINITSHLGAGLGSVINAYINSSTLNHEILELEKTNNPCDAHYENRVITIKSPEEICCIASKYDVCLIHYYCCPNIVSALLKLNKLSSTHLIAWCHNNGNSVLQPLSSKLLSLVDEVVLSGCKQESFPNSQTVRPVPLPETLKHFDKDIILSHLTNKISFRYIGSLSETKLHTDAIEWFWNLKQWYEFDIFTLDSAQGFLDFNVRTGDTNRAHLYDRPFCLIYPLRNDHYGCGELGLQELLMLGYPVIICRNLVESEISKGLLGVYYADDITELIEVSNHLDLNWVDVLKNWEYRAQFNSEIIQSSRPYQKLDLIIERVASREPKRKIYEGQINEKELLMLAYDQNTHAGLSMLLDAWKASGQFYKPNKGSPTQFSRFFSNKFEKKA